jgi:hypothetical protein
VLLIADRANELYHVCSVISFVDVQHINVIGGMPFSVAGQDYESIFLTVAFKRHGILRLFDQDDHRKNDGREELDQIHDHNPIVHFSDFLIQLAIHFPGIHNSSV